MPDASFCHGQFIPERRSLSTLSTYGPQSISTWRTLSREQDGIQSDIPPTQNWPKLSMHVHTAHEVRSLGLEITNSDNFLKL